MEVENRYETVVGLEIHARLLTQSKLFCGDNIAFGDEPNTNTSPITLGHPGTLPKMNRKVIEYAVKMGLACNCSITPYNYFARKNYFYPDLPKGYQVSQHTTPVCKGGFIMIKVQEGEKKIRLNRIHMEEDAGKSIHDGDDQYTCVDYNRAGTALIEIVSEPDIRNGEEAAAYLSSIRQLLRYLDICDGNMEEGSLRCDVNVSVRRKGEQQLGTRVEVKNLNSIRNVRLAVEAEAKRLIGLLENGETIVQETRSFDADRGISFGTREKEDADDYRYFPEPDLAPFHLQDEFIERIQKSLPALPAERMSRYVSTWQLSTYDAAILTEERSFSDYFERLCAVLTKSTELIKGNLYKAAANWMLGPVKSWINENGSDISSLPVSETQLAELITMVAEGHLSFSVASTTLFSYLLKNPGSDPRTVAKEQNLWQQSDDSAIGPLIDKVLEKFSDKVVEYRKGKKGLLSLFVGEVMKQSKGKADPKRTNELLLEKLNTK